MCVYVYNLFDKYVNYRLGKPVRCMLDRDEDMMISGTRHPFLFKYKVGFNNDGLIKVAKVNMYNNAGYSHDLSVAVSKWHAHQSQE